MRAWLAFSALVALAGIGMCVRDQLSDRAPSEPGPARPLGVYGLARPDALERQALIALERDARRREHRFRDAAEPGHLFSSTRVTTEQLRGMDPAAIYEIGAQLFHHRFTRAEGFGGKDRPGLSRIHDGRRGGPDAYTCAACHRRGGPAGAGSAVDNSYLDGDGDRPDSAFERNPPSLSGAGIVELLAKEMTRDLQAQRDQLRKEAARSGEPTRGELTSKGLSFGAVTAEPNGRLDTRELSGIDPDLVVRPFGWKGHAATVREMVDDQLALHHGMQSTHFAAGDDPAIVGPFGSPDPDGDGVVDEITEGQIDALTLFVAMQEVPQVGMPTDTGQIALWSEGQHQFEELGCAGCHVPSLPLESTVFRLEPRDGGPAHVVDLAEAAAEPRLTGAPEGAPHRVYLFSDLKRHVVGPYLRESRRFRGISGAEFVTPPLWGVARSGPWLHDGRAPTLDRTILEHSGEAIASSRAYDALNDEQRAPLRIYLMSLTRARRVMSPGSP